MDAKDILGLPKNSLPIPHEKKSRPPKESQRKPDGISRELYMLTGGMAPLMPSIDVGQLKKCPPSDEKITWQWLPFTNSARKDDLQLYHWVRVVNGVPPSGDYAFAKYNKKVEVTKYTDEEYEKYLTDSSWTKEETDLLFDLCEWFDLRFVVISDRFPSSRSIEELKERYYNVTRAILVARASSPTEIAGHPLVKEPYNAEHEIERKRALSLVLSQTKQQERRDSEVLAEAKRIMEARRMAKAADESQLPAAVDTNGENTEKSIAAANAVSPTNLQVTPAAAAPFNAVADDAAVRASLRMLRVYLRTFALGKMVEVVNSSAGLLTVNRVEQTLRDLGIHSKPKVPTKQVCLEHLELRKEIITLLNLQKQLQYKESEGSSYRDGSYSDMPGTPKDHAFIPEPVALGVERIGKKDHKRKGPGRVSETPSSPAQKRARKLKNTD